MRSSRRALTCLSSSLLLAIGLAACGSSDSAENLGAAGDSAGFPVTVPTCGRDVTVTERPERIVSLNQGSTEILLSLGVAERMVGTATWTDPVLPGLAEENAMVERLDDNNPSLEAVLDVEPDLVTASFTGTLSEAGTISPDRLADLGVPSYLSASECGKSEEGNTDGTRSGTLEITTIYQEIRDLATLVGEPARGEDLIASLEGRLAAVDKPGRPVSALFWFANAESPYMAGCCGGPGIISRALGLENVFADTEAEWPQIGWETVASRDPDVLIIGDLTRKKQTAETAEAKIRFLESNPVTREMTAVKNKRYIRLAGGDMNPSIRTVDGVEKVATGLREFGLSG